MSSCCGGWRHLRPRAGWLHGHGEKAKAVETTRMIFSYTSDDLTTFLRLIIGRFFDPFKMSA